MYATDPFLFWVFAKAPVIIYRGGEWGGGVSMRMKFFWEGSHDFRGKLRVDQLSSTEYIGGYIENQLSINCHRWGGEGDHNNKEGESGSFFRDLTKIHRPLPRR